MNRSMMISNKQEYEDYKGTGVGGVNMKWNMKSKNQEEYEE